MKAILIDVTMYGHHQPYFEALMDGAAVKHQVVGVVPSEYENPAYRLIYLDFYKKGMDAKSSHVIAYLRWIWELHKIVKQEKPDVIHFLYGDVLYRYFGAGLCFFGKAKVIATFHQIRRSRLRDYSIKRISRHITWGVFHTDTLVEQMRKIGIENLKKVEYPCLGAGETIDKKQAQRMLGFDLGDRPVLLALGGTRQDKGLDLLLEALNEVGAPFYLLVAGYPEMFDENYIKEHSKRYGGQVKCILKYLSEKEFSLCLAVCDFVVLPYRRVFDGASGPLGEGVVRNKVIIGPDHGSLGKIITENHLGYVFETENVQSLVQTIKKALAGRFEKDEKYRNYQREISPEKFVENYLKIYEENRT